MGSATVSSVTRTFLGLVAAGALVVVGISPVGAHAGSAQTASASTAGFYDSHGRVSTFDEAGMGYVRDRSGRTHVIHLRGGSTPGLWYLTRKHGAAPGPSGWSRTLVPGSAKLAHRGDSVSLVLSLSGDRLYLAIQAKGRLYIVSKRPGAANFPAITAAAVTIPSGLTPANPRELQLAALPGNQLAVLATVPAPGGLWRLAAYVVTPGHVLSQTTLLASGHGSEGAQLSYDPDSGWLIAGATEGHIVFVWQRDPSRDTWSGAQQAEFGTMSSLTTMHGHAYMGLNSAHQSRPAVAVDRLGTVNWSGRRPLPHSPHGSGDILLQADPEHDQLQAIYAADDSPMWNHIDHQVRAKNDTWSSPTRISPQGELALPEFLVLTNAGGYRFAYDCLRNCT
jgi:hypothetical protein